jgi:uncharacterized protein YbaA (DUF1428 family)
MDYVDGFVAAVPRANREAYLKHATRTAALFREHGALRVVETWEDDVPDGKLTSFPLAVKRGADEAVVMSWVVWPSKEVRAEGWKRMMEDPRMQQEDYAMPFDGQRMIYGGFQTILDA